MLCINPVKHLPYLILLEETKRERKLRVEQRTKKEEKERKESSFNDMPHIDSIISRRIEKKNHRLGVHRNSMALKHPRSGTCFNSSCWNLGTSMLVSTCLKWMEWGEDCDGLLFALGMKIDSTYFSLDLIETDVIEAFKRGPDYCSNSVVWN